MLPRGIRVHAVEPERFTAFKNELSGLNANNAPAVQAKLVEMGLCVGPALQELPVGGVGGQELAAAGGLVAPPAAASVGSVSGPVASAARPVAALGQELRLQDQAMGTRLAMLMGQLQGGDQSALMEMLQCIASALPVGLAGYVRPAQTALPDWAKGMADTRSTLRHDQTQTLLTVAINNRVGLAIKDSGAYKTTMDVKMAEAFGLRVRRAVQGNCGRYGVPGSGVEHDYAGVVEEPFELRVGEHVRFQLRGMRVIDHPFPLFLLGADILCGGRKPPGWNYEGVDVITGENGEVSGSIRFRCGA